MQTHHLPLTCRYIINVLRINSHLANESLARTHANLRSFWKQSFNIWMPFLSALYSDQETHVPPLCGTCRSAAKLPRHLAFSRGKCRADSGTSAIVSLSLHEIRASFCFHQVWAQSYSGPGKATLQTTFSPVVHIFHAGPGHGTTRAPGGSSVICCAKLETRERENNEEELHMRRRSCEDHFSELSFL